MTVGDLDLERFGRDSLINLIGCLRTENARIQRDLNDVCATLQIVQARGTELLEENRKLRSSLILPGWFCTKCGVFNGEAKEPLAQCRACA